MCGHWYGLSLMNLKKISFFLITILSLSGNIETLHAQSGNINLTLHDAIERAYQNNEEILISKENLKRITNTYYKVRAEAFPRLDGSVDWTRYWEAPEITVDFGDGTQSFPLKQDWEFNAGATLSQIIWSFGKVATAIQIA
ncbi:MAG: hypothetical protein GF384_02370, partial [Elusimicrobia bacterium]|nr:hypothetical protein [Elusimicrobiota bacterium]